MDTKQAKALYAEHGSMQKAATAAGVSKMVIFRALHREDKGVPVTGNVSDVPVCIPMSKGISLKGVTFFSKKPADTLKARFYALKRGTGYRLDDLVREWGVSADTLRQRAKEHNAFGYVEATPGEFVAIVVHPDTQKQGI
jgi:hypothetical protein